MKAKKSINMEKVEKKEREEEQKKERKERKKDLWMDHRRQCLRRSEKK